LNRDDIDIMLEVKDKNLSAIKAINLTREDLKIKYLEEEWSRYKYLVLEHSKPSYDKIRSLLKEKREYPVLAFYDILERALQMEGKPGDAENAAKHVWGYFKDKASLDEKKQLERRIKQFREGSGSLLSVKRYLWKLTLKYREPYLLSSYYFNEVM
ncbi:MAG: damage endonuclease, partial [Clostridiales bacterium]|nr:damage endonuclease [Clostridiales bacterium]